MSMSGSRLSGEVVENVIFNKTDKGREEIVTRKYQLHTRLRSLLVLIDGKKGALELLLEVRGLGLTAESLAHLRDGAYIEIMMSTIRPV